MNDEIRNKSREFIRKAKKNGFAEDTIFICGTVAYSKEFIGREINVFQRFIELLDKYPDENKFLEVALTECGVWGGAN